MIAQAIKTVFFIAVVTASLSQAQQAAVKRSQFNIPLANLSISYSEDTHIFEKVKVSFDNDGNYYCLIAPGIDYEIKITKDGRQKIVYAETPDKSYMMSDFEAKVINKVCKGFISTLETFEHDLQRSKWDKVLYLDAFFPRFLKGFYFLYCASRNSPYALPKGICIPDSIYDISLTSPKSDYRINQWQTDPDHIIKLRIISKELIFQIKEWQDKELDNPKRNPEISYGKKFEEAFTLFMKIYFNIRPIPDIPPEGQHL